MSNVANILEDYQSADNERRLYLYLSHHCLREEFQKIEMKDRTLDAHSCKYELKNAAWIGLLKDKILAS